MTQQEEHLLAKKYGFKCSLDPRRGGNWAKFHKGNLHIWAVIIGGNSKWQTAFLIQNYFTGHKVCDTLEEAMQLDPTLELIFEERGPQRYHCESHDWDFTIEFHQGWNGWVCEAIKHGRNKWQNAQAYKTKEIAAQKVVEFCEYNFGGEFKVTLETNQDRDEIKQTLQEKKPVCECGKEIHGFTKHSYWCLKYK